jgi:branched-chain amino acid aminotransferase
VLLGEVHVAGIDIVEKPLMPADLENADEVFITSTTRDLLPVLEIEGKQIARGNRTREPLQAAFSQFVRNYVEKHRAARVG